MITTTALRHYVRNCPAHCVMIIDEISLGTLRKCGSLLLVEIFKFLSPSELISLAVMSKSMRNCAYSTILWKRLLKDKGWFKSRNQHSCLTCHFACKYTSKASRVERNRLKKEKRFLDLLNRRQDYLSNLSKDAASPLPSANDVSEKNDTGEVRTGIKSNRFRISPRYLLQSKREVNEFDKTDDCRVPSSKPRWIWGRETRRPSKHNSSCKQSSRISSGKIKVRNSSLKTKSVKDLFHISKQSTLDPSLSAFVDSPQPLTARPQSEEYIFGNTFESYFGEFSSGRSQKSLRIFTKRKNRINETPHRVSSSTKRPSSASLIRPSF